MAETAGPREGSVALPDGRTMAYAEWGDPGGRPVLGCHGSPSSRLERHVDDPADYRRWGIRLVGPGGPASAAPTRSPAGGWRTGRPTWRCSWAPSAWTGARSSASRAARPTR